MVSCQFWLVVFHTSIAYVPLWDPGFIKFQQEYKFVPWIGEQPYTEMLFWQFSNIIIDVKIVGKIPDQHLSVWLFSNPGEKVHILGRFVPWLSFFFGPCPPDLRLTIHSNVDLVFFNNLDIYDYVGKLPEQHFSVCFFSNPGDKTLFLLKFNEARISEWNVWVWYWFNVTCSKRSLNLSWARSCDI